MAVMGSSSFHSPPHAESHAESASLTPSERAALDALVADLHGVFGARLGSVVAYGLDGTDRSDGLHALVLVDGLTFQDLSRMAPLARGWRKAGLATPLVLTRHEFLRTLDVFPLEYGNIIASHVLLEGPNPFAGVVVSEADRRRGCELNAKSHVVHLREGFIESQGDARAVSNLIAASAPAFRAVLANIVRLERGPASAGLPQDDEALAHEAERTIGIPSSLVLDVLASSRTATAALDPSALFARYVEASERVWRFVDGWKA
jgi:hypothetical protein